MANIKKEVLMDKAMKKVTKKIKTAEHILRKAEKDNVKLTAKDRARDAKIMKCDKVMAKKK
jgi:hypothetical protein